MILIFSPEVCGMTVYFRSEKVIKRMLCSRKATIQCFSVSKWTFFFWVVSYLWAPVNLHIGKFFTRKWNLLEAELWVLCFERSCKRLFIDSKHSYSFWIGANRYAFYNCVKAKVPEIQCLRYIFNSDWGIYWYLINLTFFRKL